MSDTADMAFVMEHLKVRERRCLLRIAKRLLAGQQAYGPLWAGKKLWKSEAKEEAMDMAVYLSALLEDDDES